MACTLASTSTIVRRAAGQQLTVRPGDCGPSQLHLARPGNTAGLSALTLAALKAVGSGCPPSDP